MPAARRTHPEVMRMVDRKSTRLNSSHQIISYAVFCLKKKKQKTRTSGYRSLGDWISLIPATPLYRSAYPAIFDTGDDHSRSAITPAQYPPAIRPASPSALLTATRALSLVSAWWLGPAVQAGSRLYLTFSLLSLHVGLLLSGSCSFSPTPPSTVSFFFF